MAKRKPAKPKSHGTWSPLISVVLPAYNRERAVKKAIKSVLEQSFTDWELLAVDDGSSDGTRAVIESFARKDQRIRPLASRHKGVSGARNVGLKAARGQIIAYLDSDNTWRPEYLAHVAERLTGRLRASCYAGLHVKILDKRRRIIEERDLLNTYDRKIILKGNQIDLNSFAHTADLYWVHNGFDETMTRLVDWDFILRVTQERPPEKIDAILGDYYHHRGAERVSMAADYKLNRLKVALKNRLLGEITIHLVGREPEPGEIERLASQGIRFEWHDRSDMLGAWKPKPSDVLLWHWSPWDEEEENLDRAADRLNLDCGLAFYVIPDASKVNAILARSVNRCFHFLVAETPAEKSRLQQRLNRHDKVKDINPVDTVLVRTKARNREESFSYFLGTLAEHHYPAKRNTIGIGIQAKTTENPLEWGDYQYAQSLLKAFGRKGFRGEIICRDQFLEKVPDHKILIHLFGIHHPPLPPKGDQLRCIWIISHPDKVHIEQLAHYDIVFAASRKFVAHLRKTCPGMRVEYLPQATDQTIFRPLEDIEQKWDLAFVGNSRKVKRPAATHAASSGRSLAVWGAGWEEILPEDVLQPGFLASAEVSRVYQQARVVLNDHWADQRRWGFVNNRIFDVLACNRIPLSDPNEELSALFPELPTFSNEEEFNQQLDALLSDEDDGESLAWPRQRICEAHTFDHRAHTLLQAWGRLLKVRHPDGVAPYQRPRILYLHGPSSAGTTRKRCFEIASTLDGLFEVRTLPHDKTDYRQMIGSDLIVLQRWLGRNIYRHAHIFDCIGTQREFGKTFVYEIDDYVFHYSDGVPKEFLRACDAAFVSTKHLAKLARRYNPSVFVLPNAVDAARFRDSKPARLSKNKRHVIVASTDGLGLDRVKTLADRLREDFDDLQFHFVSIMQNPRRHRGIKFHPMMDIDRLYSYFQACDVVLNLGGISEHLIEKIGALDEELDLDDFVNAKSELKFQYSGLARTPLVSESKPIVYTKLLRNDENGFLADTEEAQYEALRKLLRSEKTRRRIAERAHDEVLHEHTLAARWPYYHQGILAVNKRRLKHLGAWAYDPTFWSDNGKRIAATGRPRVEDLQQIQALRHALDSLKLVRRHDGTKYDRVTEEARSLSRHGGPSVDEVFATLRWRVSTEIVETVKRPHTIITLPLRLARMTLDWRRKKLADKR